MSPTPSPRRTMFQLSQQVLSSCLLRAGSSAGHVMELCDNSRRTVSNIKKNTNNFLHQADCAGQSLKDKTSPEARFPEFEKQFYAFVFAARVQKYPITQELIKQRALITNLRILSNHFFEELREKLESLAESK